MNMVVHLKTVSGFWLRYWSSIKEIWPEDLPIFVRISATDWTEGGWTGDDSAELAKVLKAKGVDLIDCSTGGNVATAKIPLGAGYQVPFSEQVRKEADISTGTVGMITEPLQADSIIQNGHADMVFYRPRIVARPIFPVTCCS